jgi:putative membrane protein
MHGKIWLVTVLCLFAVAGFSVTAGAAEKGISSKDKEFITKAASGGMMEVQLGKLAQQKASSKEVKDFGSKMEKEHGKANDELKNIVEQKKLTMPKEMQRKHKSTVQKLEKLSGAEFDKKYMEEMVKDHKLDIKEFKEGSGKVKDPELKAWIDKTLPTLEEHLQMAKQTAAMVGVDAKKLDK